MTADDEMEYCSYSFVLKEGVCLGAAWGGGGAVLFSPSRLVSRPVSCFAAYLSILNPPTRSTFQIFLFREGVRLVRLFPVSSFTNKPELMGCVWLRASN